MLSPGLCASETSPGAEHDAGGDRLQLRGVGAVGRGDGALARHGDGGSDQRMVLGELGRRALPGLLERDPVRGGCFSHSGHDRHRIDPAGVAELDPRGGARHRNIHRRAMIVDDDVEVAEGRRVGGVLPGRVGAQPVVQRQYGVEEADQREVGVQPLAGRGMRLHAERGRSELHVHAVAAHAAHARRLDHHDSLRRCLARKRARLGDQPRPGLGRLLVEGVEKRHRQAFRRCLRRGDARGKRPLHVAGAKADEPSVEDRRRPGIGRPSRGRNGIHVRSEGHTAPYRPAMGNESALGHPVRVGEVEPLDGEALEFRLDALRNREVGDGGAAIKRDEIARERDDVGHGSPPCFPERPLQAGSLWASLARACRNTQRRRDASMRETAAAFRSRVVAGGARAAWSRTLPLSRLHAGRA
jgi:hypothetical protein